jgi:hypothetical protein
MGEVDWRDLWQAGRERAFKVAAGTLDAVLESMRRDIEEAIGRGATFEQCRTGLHRD